jgi:hypothetical protein
MNVFVRHCMLYCFSMKLTKFIRYQGKAISMHTVLDRLYEKVKRTGILHGR